MPPIKRGYSRKTNAGEYNRGPGDCPAEVNPSSGKYAWVSNSVMNCIFDSIVLRIATT
jgi:hypothetical protein